MTRTRLLIGGLIVIAVLAAIPITAYGIVPLFVRHTVNEAAPMPAPATTASPASTSTAPPTSAPVENRTLLAGSLVKINEVDYGSGRVTVLQSGGTRFLRFEKVDIAGAPDMFVYLSDATDGNLGTYVDLGRLKGTSGSFNYELPAATDLGRARSAVIWCRTFRTLISYANLSAP